MYCEIGLWATLWNKEFIDIELSKSYIGFLYIVFLVEKCDGVVQFYIPEKDAVSFFNDL